MVNYNMDLPIIMGLSSIVTIIQIMGLSSIRAYLARRVCNYCGLIQIHPYLNEGSWGSPNCARDFVI